MFEGPYNARLHTLKGKWSEKNPRECFPVLFPSFCSRFGFRLLRMISFQFCNNRQMFQIWSSWPIISSNLIAFMKSLFYAWFTDKKFYRNTVERNCYDSYFLFVVFLWIVKFTYFVCNQGKYETWGVLYLEK